jgi:hypothetical protein
MCKDNYIIVMELAFENANKTSKYVEDRLFHCGTSEDEVEMFGTHRFLGKSAKSRSMPM